MAMFLIAGMALASMTLSVYVTLDTRDDAAVINLAGSLRMQSYRIGIALSRAAEGALENPREALARERIEFSQKLSRPRFSALVEQSGNTPLQKSYQKVLGNWHDSMEPLLASASAEGGDVAWKDIVHQYNQLIDSYVDDIDLMVTHLQRNTEGKIELLGMTEGTSIFLTIFTMIFLVMKADTNFVVPLRGLVHAAERVEKGDFAYRTTYRGSNELGLLSQTFNNMTASLEAQYRNLEQQVAERTEKLYKYNLALNFLHKTSREISSSPYDRQLLGIFLQELKKVIDVELINLCISTEPNHTDYEMITTDEKLSGSCIEDCDDCSMAANGIVRSRNQDVSLPLMNREDKFGFIFVRSKETEKLESWKYQLLKTVADTLSTAFAFHQTLDHEHRVILHEERSAIARELHDSLAQSLSYMKMEVARMKKLIARNAEPQMVENAINDLQEGLNAAYKHLRELLITFRVTLDAPNLRAALEHAVQEFDGQCSARVSLDYALGTYTMTPNEDIHVLHIVREALNNAVKHSHGDSISLYCSRDDTGEIIFAVEDNGVGMPENPERQHHYGIYTMRERAQRLDGVLSYSKLSSGGTRVQLVLKRAPESAGV
jgi:two-component system nitrate/nitrite sensor histidine kinase NarX